MSNDWTLVNKVVWITGAASGIGLYVADACYRAGAKVVATDINLSGLNEQVQKMRWRDERVFTEKQDVTSSKEWERLNGQVLERFGRVDYLVNMAGYVRAQTHRELDLEEIDRHLDINAKGLIFGSQIVGQHMLERGTGHIINIASLAGVVATPGMSLYCASKFAVRAYSIAIAQDLKGSGVSVSVICPDAVETPMLDGLRAQPSAAITFSGLKTLDTEAVWRAIVKAMKTKRIEVTLPSYRGWLAKLANLSPKLHTLLVGWLISFGQKRQEKPVK